MSVIGVISDLLHNNIRLIYGGGGILLSCAAMSMFANRNMTDFLRHE